jgi:hypothetical protein
MEEHLSTFDRREECGVALLRCARRCLPERSWYALGGCSLAVLAGLYVALAPSVTGSPEVIGLYDIKRLAQGTVLLCFAGWLLASRRARASVGLMFGALPRVARWGLRAVFLGGGLSALLASFPRQAGLEFAHFGLLFAAAAAIAAAVRCAPRWASRGVVATVALGAFLYAVTFAVGYTGHVAGHAFSLWPEASTGFSNVRIFNHYQTWTLPLLAVAPLTVPRKQTVLRGLLFALLALWWMLLFASGGRGVLIAAAGGTVSVGLVFGSSAWRWLRCQLAGAASGGGLFWLLFVQFAASSPSLLTRDLTHKGRRPQAWFDALEMAMQSFPLGAGPLHYAHYAQGNIWAHPHSAPLQWAAEWGAPAALVLLGLAVWGIIAWMQQSRFRKSRDAKQQAMRVAVTASLLAGAAHSLVSGIIVSPLSQTLAAIIIGIAWGLYAREKSRRATTSGVRSSRPHTALKTHGSNRAFQMGVAFLLGIMVWGGAVEAADLGNRTAAYVRVSDSNRTSPHYWQQGYFGKKLMEAEEQASAE